MKSVILAVALAVAAVPAAARPFVYTYQGHLLAGVQLGQTALTQPTPFQFRAYFDDRSPNLAGPIGVPEFVAYAPTRATLSVGGQTYGLKTWDGTSGVAVAIFGPNTPFGPTHFASGFIQNILGDGAGIVGDFLNSSPSPFDGTGALQPFRMSYADFFGVGFGIGTCVSDCRTPQEVDNVEPIPATVGGAPTSITLVSEDPTYKDYQFVGPPFTPYRDQATLSAPEPGAFALLGLGAAALVATRRRRV